MLEWQNVAEMATQPEDGNAAGEWHTTEHLALAAAPLGTAVLESWSHSKPTRPPSCVARWERGGCAALRCHSRKWESAVCGALVGTLSNKKEFPTTTSSGVVADHREGVFPQD